MKLLSETITYLNITETVNLHNYNRNSFTAVALQKITTAKLQQKRPPT